MPKREPPQLVGRGRAAAEQALTAMAEKVSAMEDEILAIMSQPPPEPEPAVAVNEALVQETNAQKVALESMDRMGRHLAGLLDRVDGVLASVNADAKKGGTGSVIRKAIAKQLDEALGPRGNP